MLNIKLKTTAMIIREIKKRATAVSTSGGKKADFIGLPLFDIAYPFPNILFISFRLTAGSKPKLIVDCLSLRLET